MDKKVDKRAELVTDHTGDRGTFRFISTKDDILSVKEYTDKFKNYELV